MPQYWNLAGDLLSVTDNAQNVIIYSNNMVGELVAMCDPDMGVWQYQRDHAGRIVKQIDGDNQSIAFNYTNDPLGRLLTRQIFDLKGNLAYGVTNIYDSNGGDSSFPVAPGQLYKTVDPEGYTKYGYDLRGRKTITARYLVKNGRTYRTQFAYDDMDRVTSTTYPNSGPVIANVYDNGANLAKVQTPGGFYYYWAKSFTPLDQISNIVYANEGISATYTYYANSKRLNGVTTSGNLQNLTYTYDSVGDVLSIIDGVNFGSASAGISASVSYDDLHRLLGFTRAGTSQTVSCTYDSVGNMLTYNENGSAAYTYGASKLLPHAIRTANGQKYAYDLCGNMLVRRKQSLVYNPENRLVASAVSNRVTTFGYADDGTRLWKQPPGTNGLQVWIGGIYEEKNGKTLFHISAGDRIVYTAFSSDGSAGEYYHPDHLHSAQVMSTNSGALTQHYECTAYGNTRYTFSTNAFPLSRRYTSQVLDEDTGLYYYGSRYYDPVLGRFVQPDTVIPHIFDPQSYDRYAYARDNPLHYVDPTGHAPDDDEEIPMTAGGARSMLLRDNPQAAALVKWGGQAMVNSAEAGRVAAELNPVVGTYNNGYQAVKGKDAIDTSKTISTGERILSGVQVVTAVAPVVAKTGEAVSETTSILRNTARGRASEARVLQEMGLAKNTAKVTGVEGNAIPDALTGKASIEVKDTKVVNRTRQIRVQTEAAEASGRESVLVTGEQTHVSAEAKQSFDTIVQRPDLGPQKPPQQQ